MTKPPRIAGASGFEKADRARHRGLAAQVVAGVPDLVGHALVAVGLAPSALVGVRGRITAKVVASVAEILAHLVADVPDLVGQALVAVALAPGFLGLLLAFAVRLLDVVHGSCLQGWCRCDRATVVPR